ncbi:hypothetical protein [Deinococcus misasensis]|uniref:hypothetical protein n=1 Tax=Deinococcus misasensis TaxID=392413 RepID=UPI000553728D|nr:hypothetical protein [Deinococcus misasensis]
MPDLKALMEALKLSFYEGIAIIIPGLVMVIVVFFHHPKLPLPDLGGAPKWLLLAVAAFILGHFLKALSSEVHEQYGVVLKWYQGVQNHHRSRVPWHQKMLLKSNHPLQWYFRVYLLRVVFEFVLWVLMSLYVPWRANKPNNNGFYGQDEYREVVKKVAEMRGCTEQSLDVGKCWSFCYGKLTKEELQGRERMDAFGDFFQGLVVVTLASLLLWLLKEPGWNLNTVYGVVSHLVVARILFGRYLRFHNLATRNLFRAFWHKYCHAPAATPPSPGPAPVPA